MAAVDDLEDMTRALAARVKSVLPQQPLKTQVEELSHITAGLIEAIGLLARAVHEATTPAAEARDQPPPPIVN